MTQQVHSGNQLQEQLKQIVSELHSKQKRLYPALWPRTVAKNSQDLREVILKNHRLDSETGCWVWTGGISEGGYGYRSFQGRNHHAHRLAAHAFKDFDLASNLFVCHTCDNRSCVNPDHLFIGTHLDNTNDMIAKGRHSHGEQSARAKLNNDQVREILRSSEKYSDLAERFGVSHTCICKVKLRKTWRHVHA